MKLRSSIAAAGAAALIGTGVLAVPALASAHPATHTLKFISVEKQSIGLTTMSGGQQDTDVNANGKVTGGTHAFAGATGTVKLKNLNKAGTRTAVTIVYKG